MSALKTELMNYIDTIPDEKLMAIKPLLFMLSNDSFVIETVAFDDLTDDEKISVMQAEQDFINGETVNHNDINWD